MSLVLFVKRFELGFELHMDLALYKIKILLLLFTLNLLAIHAWDIDGYSNQPMGSYLLALLT